MKRKHHFHHLWLILATYGVWFAILSGFEEVGQGKPFKASLGLFLGIATYILIEARLKE